jgi:HD-GYP domain-containing protein (c-di-GMP phosphodiesterase class II)
MISARPYRKVQSIEAVRAEVEQCSGVQFDPTVVAAFRLVLEEKGPAFFIDSRLHIDETEVDNSGSAMARWSQHFKRNVLAD